MSRSEDTELGLLASGRGRIASAAICEEDTNDSIRGGLSWNPDSRAATNELLQGLRTERWRFGAWLHFLDRATKRSLRQALKHKRAFAETTALHATLGALADPRRRRWVVASWILAVTHLGMLEEHTSIGLPNTLTLIRASLPALQKRLGVAVPVLALVTDFLDGKISRATGTVTRFGKQADFLADAAVWTWFTIGHEHSRWLRAATFAAWLVPVAAVAVSTFAGGVMKDVPRSRWIRPAAAVEVLIGLRIMYRLIRRTGR